MNIFELSFVKVSSIVQLTNKNIKRHCSSIYYYSHHNNVSTIKIILLANYLTNLLIRRTRLQEISLQFCLSESTYRCKCKERLAERFTLVMGDVNNFQFDTISIFFTKISIFRYFQINIDITIKISIYRVWSIF